MMLNKTEISGYLKEKINIFCFESTDSTNNEAKRQARALLYAPSLFVSERQTEGRGRRGRSFYSPGTGLYMTLLLPLKSSLQGVQALTCAAAAAAAEAIEELTEHITKIKWVNDILVGGKKVAGILCELITDESNTPKAVCIGIGVNLTTEIFPSEFSFRAGSIGDVDKNLLCASITNHLLAEYAHPDEHHFLKAYTEHSIAPGRIISYEKDGAVHTAKAVTIAPDGGLIVEENGIRHTLRSGEISIQIETGR